jgi:peptide/nickel transport system permease protein
MAGKFLQSREMKKLRRSKWALLSLGIIVAYVLIGIAVMFGMISKEQCDEVIGPKNQVGFFIQPDPETRYDVATSNFYTGVKRALDRSNPQAALDTVKLGRIRVAEKPVAELQAIVARVEQIKTELNVSKNLDRDPGMLPKLEELEQTVAELRSPLSGWDRFVQNLALVLGTDAQGRSIFFRGVFSIKVAIQIGLVTATISVFIGTVLGGVAGYFGGWIDHLIVWLYTTFSSIPNLVLLVIIAYAFSELQIKFFGYVFNVKDSLFPVYIAFCATFWIGTCRVIRGETMKLKQLEYVQAARTAGFSNLRVLVRHVLPNTAHLMLINFSLLLIGAIKSEVILSFLGLGVKSQPSWGIMIRDAGNNGDVMTGFFWQIGTATLLMFVLVLAFNILSDALQDAFDPKHL